MRLTILIPAYNEQNSIITVLEKLDSLLDNKNNIEIIIIDDNSSDLTFQMVNSYICDYLGEINHIIIRHDLNLGKGAAIKSGVKSATGDYILIQDADFEYDPKDIKLLMGPILEQKADVVYGSRFMGGNPHRILFFWHSIGNKLLTFVSNAFTNLNLTDMETGYKIIKSSYLKNLNLQENRFGIEPEITAKISRIPNIRIYEVGISYYGRTYAEGKKINWKDGFRALYCIFKYNIWSK